MRTPISVGPSEVDVFAQETKANNGICVLLIFYSQYATTLSVRIEKKRKIKIKEHATAIPKLQLPYSV